MSEQSSNKTIVIGRKSYSVETSLDEVSWSRLVAFTEETLNKTDESLGPDRRLLLAWLNLAYVTEVYEKRLLSLLSDYDEEESEK